MDIEMYIYHGYSMYIYHAYSDIVNIVLGYVASCTIMVMSGQKEARSRDYTLPYTLDLSNDVKGSLLCL